MSPVHTAEVVVWAVTAAAMLGLPVLDELLRRDDD